MTGRWAGLLVVAIGCSSHAADLTFEKATIPWAELERLLSKEGGAIAPQPPGAPRTHSVQTANITGELQGERVKLTFKAQVQVLANGWTLAPLFEGPLAVTQGSVRGPEGQRGLLVRDGRTISLVVNAAGSWSICLELEGNLEAVPGGHRLTLAPAGLVAGGATLRIAGTPKIGGRSSWRTRREEKGFLTAEAALGASGLDLIVFAPSVEPVLPRDGFHAVTILSLDGKGETRIVTFLKPSAPGELELKLPAGAQLWELSIDSRAQPVENAGETIRLPLKGPARIELVYGFAVAPIGIRGSYRVELPRLPGPVRGAIWQVWLPAGLNYQATQSSMPSANVCALEPPRGRARITADGRCLGFARAVLEPSRAYVSGLYEMAL